MPCVQPHAGARSGLPSWSGHLPGTGLHAHLSREVHRHVAEMQAVHLRASSFSGSFEINR